MELLPGGVPPVASVPRLASLGLRRDSVHLHRFLPSFLYRRFLGGLERGVGWGAAWSGVQLRTSCRATQTNGVCVWGGSGRLLAASYLGGSFKKGGHLLFSPVSKAPGGEGLRRSPGSG
uniref:Uncharacterized protein n=1 Tax=Pseudonaja textilis TaxID=8673 RepID=A0A670ZI02_PSETE